MRTYLHLYECREKIQDILLNKDAEIYPLYYHLCKGREGVVETYTPMHIVRPSRGTCNKLVKAVASTQGIRKLGFRDEKNYWSLTLLQLITLLLLSIKKAP